MSGSIARNVETIGYVGSVEAAALRRWLASLSGEYFLVKTVAIGGA
jgi:hypothetical protein